MEKNRDDELMYDAASVEEPFYVTEFGEKIISDRTVNGVPADDGDDDLMAEDELVSTTRGTTMADGSIMTEADDPLAVSAVDNDDAFRETLTSPHVTDQLMDDDLAIDDPTDGDEMATEKADDDHESLMERAKDKLDDLRERF